MPPKSTVGVYPCSHVAEIPGQPAHFFTITLARRAQGLVIIQALFQLEIVFDLGFGTRRPQCDTRATLEFIGDDIRRGKLNRQRLSPGNTYTGAVVLDLQYGKLPDPTGRIPAKALHDLGDDRGALRAREGEIPLHRNVQAELPLNLL